MSRESSGCGISFRNLLSLGCDKVRSGDLFRTEVWQLNHSPPEVPLCSGMPQGISLYLKSVYRSNSECFPCTPVAYTCCFKVYYQPLYTDVRHSHILRSTRPASFSERTDVVFRFLINRLKFCRYSSLKRGFVFWFI